MCVFKSAIKFDYNCEKHASAEMHFFHSEKNK